MKNKMNCKEAKSINIVNFLHSVGFTPVKENTLDAWYLSPFRNENTASFKVNLVKNVWYDFGTGRGGNILDLLTSLYQVDISGALKILSKNGISNVFSFHQQKIEKPIPAPSIVLVSASRLNRDVLLAYLSKRKIDQNIGRKYCAEVNYMLYERKYYSIGFKNDRGGYELRNSFYKACISPKTITTLTLKNTTELSLFEGFFDFLSFMVYYNYSEIPHDIVVLNSAPLLQHAINTTLKKHYTTINSYLDNDTTGLACFECLKSQFSQAINQSARLFPKHKDFNEFLMNV